MNREIPIDDLFPIIKEQLDSGGSAVLTISGTSMSPLFIDRKTSVKFIKPSNQPQKYDIIFYRRADGKYILHRIVGKNKDGYICRGDNQFENEFSVSEDSIIGIVTQYNNGKWIATSSFKHWVYSRFWVNTIFLRKFKHKIYLMLKK